MVDLTLFHNTPGNYPLFDRLNSRTGRFACYFMEWTCWYNSRITLRLLGHYRLFQLYKKDPDQAFREKEISMPRAYILHYRSSHIVKYFISRVMSFIYSIGTLGRHQYMPVEIETFNGALINEHSHILETFLNHADHDFTSAFHIAMEQINALIFGSPDCPPKTFSPTILVQFRKDYHIYQQDFYSSNTYNHSEINIQPTIKEGAKGKEKGIFSKKQILIILDLQAQTGGNFEKIDFSKTNKFEGLAALLHAFNGKSEDSWIEELNNYKTKGLYTFHSQGELRQLIADLTNIAAYYRKAGFRSIVTLADKKIRELERYKKDT